MSRAPDLSAFPIPRKGGAKPITSDEVENPELGGEEGSNPEATPVALVVAEQPPDEATSPRPSSPAKRVSGAPRLERGGPAPRAPAPLPPTYGQTVATTVRLDENRYLRLMEAGKPGPGRLRRRTIQDMLIEALDEWFERRQL